MKLTSRWKSGIAALVAVGSVFGVSAVSDVANALPPGTPPFQPGGGVTLTPSSGTFATPFNYSYNPVNQACPGDNTQGWFFSPYLTADDPAQLTFSAAGSPISALGGRTTALRDTGGNLQRNIFPNLVDGLLISFPDLSFAQTFATTPLAPGVYNVGVACFNANAVNGLGVRENARYWNTQVTFTGTGSIADAFAVGAAPAAPILSAGAGTATTKTVNIDNPDASVTSYSLNVVPAPADPLPTVAPGATSFELTGLTLGQSYDVTLTANKTGFPGVLSAPLSFSAAATGPAPVVVVNDAFEGVDVTVSWTIPTVVGVPAPASFDVTVSGPTTVTPFTAVPGPSVTIPAAGLAAGDYTATVTPNYAAGAGVSPNPGSDTFAVQLNTLLYQDITVERPAGALVLTQRCGVFGAFDAFDTTGWPGAQLTLDPVTAVDPTGALSERPIVVGGPNDGLADPLFNSYPQRGTYPTLCGVDLGAGELVTSGPLAGRYYAADGQINQVTVLDTRDGDLGWTAKGDIADLFTSGLAPLDANNSFSGDFLGWFPKVTASSTGQTVTAGPAVSPGTNGGLTSNPTLASAPSGQGLGIATLDARLSLIIPVAADADNYTARLSLTVA